MFSPFLKSVYLLIGVVGLIVFADYFSKHAMLQTLLNKRFHERQLDFPACKSESLDKQRAYFVTANSKSIKIIPNFFQFRYVENCGSAFSLLKSVNEKIRYPLFLVISLLACLGIPYFYLKTAYQEKNRHTALIIILGGVLGNFIDRITYRYVIDFIDWYITFGGKQYHLPTFNIADAAILIGVVLFIHELLKDIFENENQL